MRKECFKCKSVNDFSYKASYCKPCSSERAKEYYRKNKEKCNKSHRLWYEKNKKEDNLKSREYYKENKQFILQQIKERHKCNKDELLKLRRDYYQKVKKDRCKQSVDWAKRNKGKKNAANMKRYTSLKKRIPKKNRKNLHRMC